MIADQVTQHGRKGNFLRRIIVCIARKINLVASGRKSAAAAEPVRDWSDPKWYRASKKKVRQALLVLSSTVENLCASPREL